jgi:hypothetical protein
MPGFVLAAARAEQFSKTPGGAVAMLQPCPAWLHDLLRTALSFIVGILTVIVEATGTQRCGT